MAYQPLWFIYCQTFFFVNRICVQIAVLVGWLFCLIAYQLLWVIYCQILFFCEYDLCANSCVGWLAICFNGISTAVGYLLPNLFISVNRICVEIAMLVGWLFFYGIRTIVGYLLPNFLCVDMICVQIAVLVGLLFCLMVYKPFWVT